jgi:F-type H+-transporting ATPase subunit epsilon
MFTLSVLTPEKRLLSEQEIDEVVVPGFLGQLDILPGHAPLLTTLSTGIMRYRLKGESNFYSVVVSWGYMEVNPLGVVILAETAETESEVDRSRAETSLRESTLRLTNSSPEEMEKYQRKIERAQARLELLNVDALSH